jgi:chemotaxis signal transduction protein/HPt (histidine-containing phosphotransfer) domain-containing protein
VSEFDELIEEFVAESKEHIADIEDDLIKIESQQADADPEVLNRVFRAAHSIKGSAKFLDLVNIGDMAHKMEDVLNLIRAGKLIPTSNVAGPLLAAADMLKTMLDDVSSSNGMDISEQLSALQEILESNNSSAKKPEKQSEAKGASDTLSTFDIDPEIVKNKLQSSQVYILTLNSGHPDMDHLLSELNNLGEVMAETKKADGNLFILFATIMESDMVQLALGIGKEQFTVVTLSMLQPPKPQSAPQPKYEPPRQEPPKQAAPKPIKQEKPAMEKIVKKKSVEEEDEDQGYSKVSYDEDELRKKPASFKQEAQEEVKKEENTSFITFTLDEETYAVPIQAIEEIIGLQEISLLPNVPEYIKGVINLRGDIVPIMDLRLKFGLVEKDYTQFTVFLIVRMDERLVGMVVDNVADVLVLDPTRIQKTPAFSSKISTDCIEGIYKDTQQEMVILVNVAYIIKVEELDALAAA